MFGIGLIVGLVLGANISLFLYAMILVGKQSDEQYNNSRNEVRTITKYDEKRELIANLVELMKKTDISDTDKESIYKIIINLPNKTIKQKTRFINLYGLKPKEFKKYTLSEIARKENVTPNAIKYSTMSIRVCLYRVSEDEFQVLKSIYEKYQQ